MNGVIGIDQSGNNEECFHCTTTPEKYSTLLTKEQQPFCSRCFSHLFEANGKTNDDNNNKAAVFKSKPPPPPPKPKGKMPSIPFSTLPKPYTPSVIPSSVSPVNSSLNGPQSPPLPPPPIDMSMASMTIESEFPLPPPPPTLIMDNDDGTMPRDASPSPPPSSASSTTSSLSNHTGGSYEHPSNGNYNYNNGGLANFSIRSKTPSPNPYLATENNYSVSSANTNNNTNFIRKSPTPKSSSALAAEIINNSLLRRNPSPVPSTIANTSATDDGTANNTTTGIRKVPSPSSSTLEINTTVFPKVSSPILTRVENNNTSANQEGGFKKPSSVSASYLSSIQQSAYSPNKPSSIGSRINNKFASSYEPSNSNTVKPPSVSTVERTSALPTFKPVAVVNKPTATAPTPVPATTTVSAESSTPKVGYNKQISTDTQEETHLDQLNSIFKMTSMKKKQDDPYESPNRNGTTSKPAITAVKPTTFNCSKCKLNLLGRTVESKNGKIFCTPCYRIELAQQSACVKCGQGFTPDDPSVTYKHENWHSSCFKCVQCNLPIGAKTFCNQGPEKGLFCADCYFETSGRKCVKCKKYLKSAGFLFRNEPYHQACFVCTGCNEPLGDNEILCKDNDPYCSTCFDQKYLEKCASCKKALIGESVEYEGKQYHDECFNCASCCSPIGTTSFFPREGCIYCENCYTVKFGKTCKKCVQLIQPGLGLVYKTDHYYHRDCFICTHCSRSLSNISVHSSKSNDSPYCGDCFDELFSKRCTACSNIISGVVGSRFISFQDKHFHIECFLCKSCGTSLENRKFAPSQGEIMCIPCSKFGTEIN